MKNSQFLNQKLQILIKFTESVKKEKKRACYKQLK